jgi:hypothetical protein
VAFIETAWRRYTKHSRNKAQEIQGAILPLLVQHQFHAPFIGVILAGDFTSAALAQLKSHGFRVLHFPSEALFAAFRQSPIDAYFDESTPDSKCAAKIKAWSRLKPDSRKLIADHLLASHQEDVASFFAELETSITRQISRITILPLHGSASSMDSIESALNFVERYSEIDTSSFPISKFEIQIIYNNGDCIRGEFSDKIGALNFLKSYETKLIPVNATMGTNTE